MSAEPNVEVNNTHPDPSLPPAQPVQGTDSKSAAHLPPVPEMPGSNTKSLSLPYLPTDIKSYASKTDQLIVRLNKLIKTPGGLASLLSTTNYTLYLLAHLHLNAPTRAQVITTISRLLGRAAPKFGPEHLKPSAPSTPITPVASLISETRTSLRLVGLLPLYVWLTSLLRSASSASDPITHSIAIVQCVGYITFQVLENIAHLSNKGIVSQHWVNRNGGVGKFILWSCRGWLAGISCDFLRLFREAQIARAKQASGEKQLSKQEKDEMDRKWWAEFFVASCWLPMAVHYSVPNGIGLNLGMIGACGMGAGLGTFTKAWAATKE